MSKSTTRKERLDRIKELTSDAIILGRNADTVHKLLFEEVLIGKIEAIMQRKDIDLDDFDDHLGRKDEVKLGIEMLNFIYKEIGNSND